MNLFSSPLRILLVVLAAAHLAAGFGTNRRDFVQNAMIVAAGSGAVVFPSITNASGGDSANIIMPNYIEYLIEKNKVTDPADMLYKGPDIELQLKRIGEAGARLPEVAALAEGKKWSQVQGIITGPLGTLLQTMNNVASIAGTKEAAAAAKSVKQDLNDINAASQKKDSTSCIKAAEKASTDLEKFVKIAFK